MTSIARKVAEFWVWRIKNRPGMSAVSVVTFENDNQAEQDRIVVDVERKEETPEGSGIFRNEVTCTVKAKTAPAEIVDTWLAEMDATQTDWEPGAPTAQYTAALAAMTDLVIVNETSTDRQTDSDNRKVFRQFDVLAK